MVVIHLGKSWMVTPKNMYEVAERFPPLRERTPTWSMDRLLNEFGRELIFDPIRPSRV